MGQRTAPHDLFGFDRYGVRRRVRAGRPIPEGLRLEEPLPPPTPPPEMQRLVRDQAARGVAAKAAAPADRRGIVKPAAAKRSGRRRS